MKLHGRISPSQAPAFVARITETCDIPPIARRRAALLLRDSCSHPHTGFAGVFSPPGRSVDGAISLPQDLDYLRSGDIVRVEPEAGQIRVMYRRGSPHNSFLITERCNSKCVMCSQPPKDIDDDYLVDDILAALPLVDASTEEIGFTGGEPTLLGDRFFELIRAARDYLPHTSLHVLTNGRLFAYLRAAQRLEAIRHHDIVLGIPIYADTPGRHDFVVQAKGAFDQTLRGIANLQRCHQRVEVRVVVHEQTYDRLAGTARFITRNLPFVHHVALMGLEPIGYARTNWRALWRDPLDYQEELRQAVEQLVWAGIHVSIYNHQLCTLPRSLWPYAVQSVSDWKNIYLAACEGCSVRARCGGFFAWAEDHHSRGIQALSAAEAELPTV